MYYGVLYAALFFGVQMPDSLAEGFGLQLSRGVGVYIEIFYTALLLMSVQSCTSIF